LALDLSVPLYFKSDDGMNDFLPFEYRGGFLGYLGYEVRHDNVRHLHQVQKGVPFMPAERSSGNQSSDPIPSDTPTAAFFLARNSLVFHHPTDTWYMLSLLEQEEGPAHAFSWMQATKGKIARLARSDDIQDLSVNPGSTLEFTPNRPKESYMENIARCHELIHEGESYELCLTNQLETWVQDNRSTWDLYKILRRRNPAPYSAFFKWQQISAPKRDLSICCSSPERFMSVKRQQLHPETPMILQAEAKPIKGTAARVVPEDGVCRNDVEAREDERRARSLELSLKNRAENLMIVDLLRNDMSRVCQIGSVHVAKLMAIESFQTVHQMVSTIRGTLCQIDSANYTPRSPTYFDLLRASFPGGSMTGAPKIRTMELLEELEQGVERGPYSGSLGYLSVNGCMDMNIIIRSAVVTKGEGGKRVRIGAGGAITVLSESCDEYEEMLLKARAVAEAVQIWDASSGCRARRVGSEASDRETTEDSVFGSF
jgi:para-aminobenzoate synthetase